MPTAEMNCRIIKAIDNATRRVTAALRAGAR